jgi:hypothetical protein
MFDSFYFKAGGVRNRRCSFFLLPGLRSAHPAQPIAVHLSASSAVPIGNLVSHLETGGSSMHLGVGK